MKKKSWIIGICYLSMGLAAVALILVLASGLGNRFGFLELRQAMTFYRWAVTLSLPATVVSLLSLAFAIYLKLQPRLIIWVLAATLFSIFICAAGQIFRYRVDSLPFIHDITTDTENP